MGCLDAQKHSLETLVFNDGVHMGADEDLAIDAQSATLDTLH
jgi:hypothetical protein